MRRAFSFGLVLLFSAVAAAADVGALSAEFKTLRTQGGHFSGGAWNDVVDKFGGRKHEVMVQLGEALGDGMHTRSEIIALLGPPDLVLKPGDTMFRDSYTTHDPRVRELLVYHWRGMHDFLYFAGDGTQVFVSGWWNAWE